MEIQKQQQIITDQKQLLRLFFDIESRCLKLDNYEDAGMTIEQMIEKLMIVLQSIKDMQMFSPNQTIKEVHTEQMKLLTLPYWLGWLYSRVQENRMKAVLAEKDFLCSFLSLMDQFNCQDEEVFPKGLKNIWLAQSKEPSYRPPRDQLVQAMKDKKAAEMRYSNWQKIKEESDKRQAIKDYITIQIHESITMLRAVEEEISILKYKDSIQKDQKAKEEHERDMSKPIPKMKVQQILPKEEIQHCMCPPKTKKELVAQVWQQNANKPTISLEEVGQMEIDNALAREKRQAKQREENKVDSDSDKEENDHRKKKEARAWDDWKDNHQKGAGNLNKG